MQTPQHSMDLPPTGSAEHEALVTVIERLRALEIAVDRLAATTERRNDPLKALLSRLSSAPRRRVV